MQRIEVKNFGPLKDINLEIKDYMVFIGPQASGKSTLAKLIYFFWKVEDKFNQEILSTYVLNKILKTHNKEINYVENWKRDIRKLFSEIFPTYRNGTITFVYRDGYDITLDVVSYSEKFTDDIQIGLGFKKELEEVDERIANSPNFSKLLREKKVPIDDLLEIFASEFVYKENDSTRSSLARVFVPAGRSILSIFANSITLIESNSLDYFNEEFVKFVNSIRRFIESSDYLENFGWMARLNSRGVGLDNFSFANDLSLSVLKGDFSTDSKGDGIMHYFNGSGYLIPLKHTSSGQQESTWLINILQYLLFKSKEIRFDVIVEEPEAHLFPDAQRDITKLITLFGQSNPKHNRVLVTTHSPYVLATLNNSIKAFSVAKLENKSEEVKSILSPEFWVNPENLFVGFMNKNEDEDNFSIDDIFDPELGLIKHEVLDNVSDDIMKQFDELLDIQYSE